MALPCCGVERNGWVWNNGVWRSLVARTVRDREVGSSSLPTPTRLRCDLARRAGLWRGSAWLGSDGMWRRGSALVWGTRGREFESPHPDSGKTRPGKQSRGESCCGVDMEEPVAMDGGLLTRHG